MDISNINTQYLNSAYVPFSSSAVHAGQGINANGPGSFEEILKRAQDSNAALNAVR